MKQTAKQILESIGWPTQYVVMDFESYFDKDYSLKKMSHWEYVTDPRFELTGMAVNVVDNEPWFFPPAEIQHRLNNFVERSNNLQDVVVVMQNAKFDATILAAKYNIYPKYIIDTKHLAAHLDARGSKKLKDLAPAFGLEAKGHTDQFKGLHWDELDQKAIEDYAKQDARLELKLFELLLPRLTCPEVELPIAHHTTELYTRPRLDFGFGSAKELILKMQARFTEVIEATGHAKEDISGNKSFVKLLEAALPNVESVPMKQGKKGLIPALAKTDEAAQALKMHPDPHVRALMNAREGIRSWPNHIKRIKRLTKLAAAAGGKLPIPLSYYGAHTGRWSGSEQVNLQNLGGRGRAGQGTDPLISGVRKLIRAPKGHKLVIVDAAQIEARVLAWLAGEEKLVKGFANGEDVYSQFGTTLFQAKVRKPKPTDPAPLASLLSIRRGFAKDGVLGCGYGLGGTTFHTRCVENPTLRPLFDSGAYTEHFSHGVVKTYRKTYSRIPEFWESLENMFTIVTRFPSEVWRWRDDLLTVWNEDGTVVVQLPSGRCLFYKHAAWSRAGLRYHYGPLWGGTLTENVVQAVARDLLAWWILRCEKERFPIVHHVHDEVISLVPDERAERALDCIMAILRQIPKWAEGCPVDAEGMVSEGYAK